MATITGIAKAALFQTGEHSVLEKKNRKYQG
jgi:hypothetical protein